MYEGNDGVEHDLSGCPELDKKVPEGVGHYQTALPPAVAADFAQKRIRNHGQRVASKAKTDDSYIDKRNHDLIGAYRDNYICLNYVREAPTVDRNNVLTMITFLPSLSASIDSKMSPTTLPTNSAEMIEFLIYN